MLSKSGLPVKLLQAGAGAGAGNTRIQALHLRSTSSHKVDTPALVATLESPLRNGQRKLFLHKIGAC